MIPPFRLAALPPGARDRVRLDRGERPLASAGLTDGGVAVATTHRLVVAGPAAGAADMVTADRWVDVASASLAPEEGVLEVDLVAGSRRVLVLGRNRGRALATVVRERVQHSVLLTRTVELAGRRAVRVTARRTPDGEVLVQVVPGPGVSISGPDVAAEVAEAERAVREQVGLPPPG
ncbi:MAG: hypothetical protein ACFCVG_09490 [Kineosporiaceae bacterium]